LLTATFHGHACFLLEGDGKRVVIDGPFAETKEQLGGYFLIDARDLDEAIAIAARIPMASRGTVEVRPVIHIADLPAD